MRAAGPEIDEMAHGRPCPSLRPYVAAYHGYRQRGVAPAVHRGLPSPYLTVIFTLDDPLHVTQHVDPRQAPGSYRALIGGLHTAPALISHAGAQSGVQLLMNPLGARSLFGVPAGELTSIDIAAADLLGPYAEDIQQRLQAARSWPARFAVLDAMLTARLCTNRADVPAEVRHAWRLLLRSGGAVSVAGLARETGWSTRHLTKRMRAEAGLSPKAAGRVIRFDQARRILQAGTGAATVAAECGYYDQSHLIREFHALAGLAPSHWLAAEFGNVQAPSAATATGLAS